MEGLYLEQVDNEYHFLRLYADGELLFVTATYTWARPKAIAAVSGWLRRGQKKNPVQTYSYRNEGGVIAFEYAANKRRFEVRGEVDAVGRVVLRWRDVDLGSEWVRVYSRVSEDGAVVPVNVNAANADGLTDLPGVTKALALRIVEYREQHGDFQKPEDLLKVKGITEAKLSGFRERCDFAPKPAALAAPEPTRLVVTLDVLARQLADADSPPSPARAASFRRKLGRFDVYLEERTQGRYPLTIVACARAGDAFELRGFNVDKDLLEPLLETVDKCSEQELKELTGVRVLPLVSQRFNRAVIVPGHLHSYYPAPLGAVVHRVYPTRDFEVSDGMRIEVFEALTNGGGAARLDLFDWGHVPHPLVWLRVIEPPPGTAYEAMQERELANSENVAAALERYMKAGKVELWDIADRHAIAEGTQKSITIRLAGADHEPPTEIAHESFGVALDRFLKGGTF
jgi:competence ComEA-like helix-hairpin-helix protein